MPQHKKTNMATFIFKTHAQAACLTVTKNQCAPSMGLVGCACLTALDKLVDQYSKDDKEESLWDLAQALRMRAKYHLLHRSDVHAAKASAKKALAIVYGMPSTPKIDTCVFESDYAMAMHMAGDHDDKERAKTLWCRIMDFAINSIVEPGVYSEHDLLYKHTLCDRMICESVDLPRGRDRKAALERALALGREIGHAHRHMLEVDIELF